MTVTEVESSIDATIAAAVNSRVSAQVMAALSGDEVIGQFVTAALMQPVEIKNDRTYRTTQRPFLQHVIQIAIQDAAKKAVAEILADESGPLLEEVRKAVRRNIRPIADALVDSLAKVAERPYGIKVELAMPGRE